MMDERETILAEMVKRETGLPLDFWAHPGPMFDAVYAAMDEYCGNEPIYTVLQRYTWAIMKGEPTKFMSGSDLTAVVFAMEKYSSLKTA